MKSKRANESSDDNTDFQFHGEDAEEEKIVVDETENLCLWNFNFIRIAVE